MTRVLVTGGNGQVGRSIAQLVEEERFAHLEVTVTDRRTCDIASVDSIRHAIDRVDPAVIINAAAYTAVDAAQDAAPAALLANRDGVAHLAAHTGRRLIHLSTDYVFDGTKAGWYVEDDPVAPLGVYGESKWQGEQAAATNPDHLILRTAWVYAAHGHNFVKTMLRLGAERNELRVVADQIGCPSSAHDIADALLQLVDTDATGTFHLAGSEDTSWHGFAVAIFDHARLDVTVDAISTADYPTPAPRPANSRLDSTALEAHTGVRLPSWRTALPGVIDAIITSDPLRTSS
ncbi:MAG: dTDP-4-dehydrorhamnose reductase [Actinomycetota bacterium]